MKYLKLLGTRAYSEIALPHLLSNWRVCDSLQGGKGGGGGETAQSRKDVKLMPEGDVAWVFAIYTPSIQHFKVY